MAYKDYEARAYIGTRLAQIREEVGYTREQVAEMTGLTPKNILRIEQGKYNVSIDSISNIASVLGAHVDVI